MNIVTLDFETTYSKDYSLRKLRTVEYILDPRFECIMCAIKINAQPSKVYYGHEAVAAAFADIDWSKCAVLSHNARFDMGILAWHFGIVPKFYLDTLGMARAITHAILGKSALAEVAAYLGIGTKGTAVHDAIGKHLADFTPAELQRYGAYCANDNDLCYQIFTTLMASFPKTELDIIDMIHRMYICAQDDGVVLNKAKLAAHWQDLQVKKTKIMAAVNHVDFARYDAKNITQVFSSSQKFAKLMQDFGLRIPYKKSKTTGEWIPALAKNDREFKDLCADETLPLHIQVIFAARISAKSTLEETRTVSLIKSALICERAGIGTPVPLRYAAAHTHRLGGDDKQNWQNFGRNSPIRDAIEAPRGMRILHRDSSSIEARMLAFLAKCERLLEAYEQGRDVYSEFASEVYGRKVDKSMKTDRFVGKTCLAGDTTVVTDKGLVRLDQITTEHKIWDGVEWVSHEGLMAKGTAETITFIGCSMTPDHHIWCGQTMIEARQVCERESYLTSALAAASLPLLDTCLVSGVEFSHLLRSVTAGAQNIQSTSLTSESYAAHDVTSVLSKQQAPNDIGCMLKPCLTTHIEHDYSTGSLLPLQDATPPPVRYTPITGAEVLQYIKDGVTTEQVFFDTSRLFRFGASHGSTWTEKITTKDTSQETSALFLEAQTLPISDVSQTLSNASVTLKNVYDLANAGPRHRFTIMTDVGPLIVSNCVLGLGYQTGGPKLQHTLYIGQGGISAKIDLPEANRIVRFYRTLNKEIPALWALCEKALDYMIGLSSVVGDNPLVRGITIDELKLFEGVLRFGPGAVWSPNDLAIQYPNLRREMVEQPDGSKRKQAHYDDPYKQPRSIYGGKMTENVTQHLSRNVIMDIARRVRKQTDYIPFMSTHDSLDYLVPEGDDTRAMDGLLEYEFAVRPTWAQRLPLASEGGWGVTLKDAENARNN